MSKFRTDAQNHRRVGSPSRKRNGSGLEEVAKKNFLISFVYTALTVLRTVFYPRVLYHLKLLYFHYYHRHHHHYYYLLYYYNGKLIRSDTTVSGLGYSTP